MSGGAGYVLSRQGSGVRSGLRGRIRAFSWIRAAGSDPGCGVRSGLQGRIRAAGSPPGSGVGSGQRGRIRAAGSDPGSGVASGQRGRIRAFGWIRAAGSDPSCGVGSGQRGRIRAAGLNPGCGAESGLRGQIRAPQSEIWTFVTIDFFFLNIHWTKHEKNTYLNTVFLTIFIHEYWEQKIPWFYRVEYESGYVGLIRDTIQFVWGTRCFFWWGVAFEFEFGYHAM